MEKTQKELNYERIAKAIQYIQDHFQEKPSLEEIAEHVHLSPFHFQRLFTDWAGTSPKKFLQYTQVNYAKKLLKEEQKTLFETHLLTGVGSTSRLHDMFVQIEGMTPAEFKQAGEGLTISYSFQETPFGICLVGSTEKGICYMAFVDNQAAGRKELKENFENAEFIENELPIHLEAIKIFNPEDQSLNKIKLHLKGTAFQLKVWQALLQIPLGKVSSYKDIAIAIDQPSASRAVGTAIGQNPIAFLIPCHRVIQTTGQTGGYRWKPIRKTVILGWEFAHKDKDITHEAI
ncbi:bifunctional transcriptional activator/DNA repair enzyme AdaA [Sphingobacterium sp. 1.A.5]|jgi:AraC family transcriptional regulator of adaptative response/methylated-DNA-[protein]-cysteine methyltransferase|uniref:bifunctional transcriptional activator/DNA repair enzyme AdaA n=1 Tax=Sphingobacterium sp. 1.A.5 TaxID=2044604 RepID=UPI000C0BFA10|nr:methylated-DNA--[protein]-cysteine S-methyltransferase [Sphingobacterium sp. 1.A.5]